MFSGMLIECISGHRNALYSFRQEVGGNSSLCESDGQIRGLCKPLREQVSQDSNPGLPRRPPPPRPREGFPLLSVRNQVDCKSRYCMLGFFLLEKPGLSFDKIDLIAAWFCLAVALEGN